MLGSFKQVARDQRRLRPALYAGLLLYGVLLYRLADGFPPWAWRFSLQVVPRLPDLLALRGTTILLPLIGLLLLSFLLFVLWGTLAAGIARVTFDWWHERQERKRFHQDVEEAETLAERMAEQVIAQEIGQQPTEGRTVLQTGVPARAGRAQALHEHALAAGQHQFFSHAVAPQNYEKCTMRGHLRVIHPVRDTRDFADKDTLPAGEEFPLSRTALLEERREAVREQQEMLPRLLVGAATDPGLTRKHAPNEDSMLAIQGTLSSPTGQQPVGLFVVADGMGGHAHGMEASRLAVQVISDTVLPSLLRSNQSDEGDARKREQTEAADELFVELLKEGVHRANLAIYQRNRHKQDLQQKMGTTVTAVLVVGSFVSIVNVGDSRTYLYRRADGLQQLTRDHSLVSRLVESGAITRDEVYTHPNRNQIYRCLGDHPTVQADLVTTELQDGDLLLLCSDGLWEMVRDPDIEKIIRASLPHTSQLCAMLIQAALARGGEDNVTVVAVQRAHLE